MVDGDASPLASVVRAGEGESISAAGIDHLFKVTGAESSGLFGLEEFLVGPATMGARPHVHRTHDEYFYIVGGELTVTTDEGDVVLGPGDVAHAGRGSLHGFRNDSATTPARVLCAYTPAGYEQYFRDVHAAVASTGRELTAAELAELRAGYDTTSY